MKPKVDLKEFEDNWVTEMGASFPGERVVVRGKDLFSELNHFTWLKLLLYMITGREFNSKELEILDKIWMLTISYPDPRVWNNRVAALAGTVRSTGSLGVSAGSAVTEAKVYGGQATTAAFDFILRCAKKLDQGYVLKDLLQEELRLNRAIYGYGRPIVNRDERIKPIQDIIEKNGYGDGRYVRLAYQVEQILQQGRWRYKLNIAGLAAAIAADMGFSDREYYLWLINGYNAGITACFADAIDKKEGALFPLRCERITYEGKAIRTWE